MVKINENFLKLEKNYLFIDIAKKINAYKEKNPDKKIIRMGIGDVTLPLAPVVVEAFKKGCDEMGVKETFKGYEDSGAGYDFLKQAVADYYKNNGVELTLNEIRINDGAKSDCGNIIDIFGENVVLLTDPVYPVYANSNIMQGNTIIYANSNEENNFTAMPSDISVVNEEQKGFKEKIVNVVNKIIKPSLIYLCSPNNPTGSVYNKEQLKEWVDYALKNEAIIIFDAAYEAFITDSSLPRSIFEIEGAKKCAIEMCSLSKTAGFTGVRCGYTVIPEELVVKKGDTTIKIADLWSQRQGSKFNGISYPVQCAAAAVFTDLGQKQIKENIAYYQANAKIIADTLTKLNIKFTGGINSPYIWFKCPDNQSSWEFFDRLLNEIQVVGTPGAGFGKNGEGWFRLTAFGDKDLTLEAMERLTSLLS
ncbi:MAG: LL-diaminopimelate aminotransferase [Oscillospiraceae bacterium]|nr:LL-diaminopimelate aminotransferase [Oscillospiraceae bacterium]